MEARPNEALKAALISQNCKETVEFAQNANNCSKQKKMLKIQEVADYLPRLFA